MSLEHLPLLEEARQLDRSGQRAGALLSYRRYLHQAPEDAQAWADYAGLLVDLGRTEDCLEACRRALELDQGCMAALINLAAALQTLERHRDSAELYGRILRLEPGRWEAQLGLGRCLALGGDLEGARGVLEAALAQRPDSAQARQLLAHVLAQLKGWPAFREVWQRLVELEYRGQEARWELSSLRLLFGELREGFALFESRLAIPGFIQPPFTFQEPRWDGAPFSGRTLLLHWEQGFGDTVMAVRYAPLVKALGGRVVLVCQKHLAGLMGTCAGLDQVIPHGEPLPPFDLWLPLLSLPHVMGTELDRVPAEVPYLDVPPDVPHREKISRCLATAGKRVRAGVVWAGSSIHKRDAERSMPPTFLEPLARVPGVAWFSLQREAPEERPLPGMESLAPFLSTFADTAYAISGLDLLVTVDTAVAHVAGALGVPTLMALNFIPDWRWMLEREDSPWYPTLRIYRQQRPGDWAEVVERIVRDLS